MYPPRTRPMTGAFCAGSLVPLVLSRPRPFPWGGRLRSTRPTTEPKVTLSPDDRGHPKVPPPVGRLKNGAGRYEGPYTACVTGVAWGNAWSGRGCP